MTALHGFLGRGGDWDGILPAEWQRPDWLPFFHDARDLDDVARSLNAIGSGDVLLGYSMGGRIAMHMLIAEPKRWRRAIIVSAAPGIPEADRAARTESDRRWADRFRKDDWSAVISDWNAQPVFRHDPPDSLPRRKSDFDLEALARALEVGSVARQRDLRPELAAVDIPIRFIAGAQDAKYAQLAEECAALNPNFDCRILDAGHRVPWGATDAFRAAIAEGTQ